jgi:hypothetical protein
MIDLKLQPKRSCENILFSDIKQRIEDVLELSVKYNLSYSDVIETYKMLQQERSNDIKVSSGDIMDEHLHEIKQMLNIFVNQYCERADL